MFSVKFRVTDSAADRPTVFTRGYTMRERLAVKTLYGQTGWLMCVFTAAILQVAASRAEAAFSRRNSQVLKRFLR